jgi:signal transduction histidine kinase
MFVGSYYRAMRTRTDPIRVLHVDDEPDFADVAATHLEREDDRLTVETATDTSEGLERQNDRLEEFAGVISHDLRNPLNVAMGRIAHAQNDCESDHLDPALSALDRMEEMIEDILALTRAGQAVEEPELVAPTEMTIRADESRLRNFFENLYRNAVEHGGEDVTVTVGQLDDRDGFFVADDGPGIPEAERDDVFEAGYSTAEGATGFGLNIVEEIADAHEWDVRTTDSEDGGARFEVTGVEVVDR